jgi:hypothetical protein
MAAHRTIGARGLAPVCLAAIAVTGCGSGSRQDANEPKGDFPVQVLSASFPAAQRLATTSNLVVVVRNPGPKEIPIVSVTVKCPASAVGGFAYRTTFKGVADAARPRFVINTIPTRTPRQYDRGRLDPLERSSSYVDTYPLGPLAAGRTATFRWNVTAARSGPYRICYRVNAGLNGKAKAVPAQSGGPVDGQFVGVIAEKPPQAHIGADGRTVVEGRAVSGNTP